MQSAAQTRFPPAVCLHQLFEAQVERTPEAVAVVCEGRQLTYRELDARANQIARYLRQLGVRPETLVALWLERSPDLVAAMLGILKAGGAYVPLDPDSPADRLQYILTDCHVHSLLSTSQLAARLPEFAGPWLCLDVRSAEMAALSDRPLSVRETEVTPEHLCYVMYTSGSTGRPKGVLIEHRSACNLVRGEGAIFQLQPADRVFQGFSIAFDASVEEIWLAFYSGATLVLGTRGMLRAGPGLARILTDQRVTVLCCVPTLLALMAEEIPSLRLLLVGGEPCPQDLVQRWSRPGLRMVNGYGPTETTVIATYADLYCDRPVTIGRPLPNYSAYILDENLQPVPPGQAGELHIGGVGLARGYLGLPEPTRRQFIPNPFHPLGDESPRLYKTGDLAQLTDGGDIEYLGRIDTQVKIRGFRVELGEIESVLSQFPGVRQAVVLPCEDGSRKTLVAYLVAVPGSRPAHAALRSHVQERLPDYMVPTHFMLVDSLPLTANGKVDRQALPAPGDNRPELANAFVPPRSALEKPLASLWAEVLGLRQVGVHDNFFDLGGHSLLIVRLLARIEERLGWLLPAGVIFEKPTVAQLAAFLADRDAVNGQAHQAGETLLPRPYLFCLNYGPTLSRHLGPGQPVFALHLEPELTRRHTRIADLAAQLVERLQKVQPEGPYYLSGYCEEGTVAIEMSRQLAEKGQTVAFLALLDCTPFPSLDRQYAPSWLQQFGSRLSTLFGYVQRGLAHVGKFVRLNPLYWPAYLIKILGLVKGALLDREGRRWGPRLRQSIESYCPSHFPGRVTVILSGDRTREELDALRTTWEQQSIQTLTFHVVPGDHYSMVEEDRHAAILGESLRLCLDQARDRPRESAVLANNARRVP